MVMTEHFAWDICMGYAQQKSFPGTEQFFENTCVRCRNPTENLAERAVGHEGAWWDTVSPHRCAWPE